MTNLLPYDLDAIRAAGGYCYLASPYSAPNLYSRLARFEMACDAAAVLMRKGVAVFSPIAHSHPIADGNDLPTTWDFWRQQDTPLLLAAKTVLVLKIDGSETSVGIREEIAIAREAGIPVYGATLTEVET